MSICSQVCKQGFIYAQAQESVEKVMGKQTLSDLMLFDAITGNVDRYLGNFGILIDNDTRTTTNLSTTRRMTQQT
ncbi:hypothetical protein HHE03_13820 [Helicobacter heilmannii]|uniref:Uncharacterized protein n=1 Tax=Helicobacter heilmannii TaxID=35817 RepID=A0A0K2XW25_HELHE|nr:hypothetical protein BN341_1100 [Helicobacter heilmannii ASB1.4]CRF49719.1 hypothetical protein HHE03_13820 [Helicobacter heilmannii]CRI33919.1 hypothetical protein HHE01_16050 [Helicobacter heilmannii]